MRSLAISLVLLATFLPACGDGETPSGAGGSGGSGNAGGAGGSGTGGSATGGSGTGGTVQNDCPAGSGKLVAALMDLGPYADLPNTTLAPLLGHGIQVEGCIGPWMDIEDDPQKFQGIDGGGDAGVVTFGGPDVDLVPPALASAFSPAALTGFHLFDHDEEFSFVDIQIKGGASGAVWEVHFKCVAEQQSPLDESNIMPVSMKCVPPKAQSAGGQILFFDNAEGEGLAGAGTFEFVL